MNCFFHVTVPAVAQCKNCGKFLCKACATKYPEMICEDCAESIHEKEHSAIMNRNIASITIFVVIVVFCIYGYYNGAFSNMSPAELLIGASGVGFIYAGIPFGWHALTKIGLHMPKHVIIVDLFIILFLGFFKLFLSLIIGWACIIWQFLKLCFFAIKRRLTASHL